MALNIRRLHWGCGSDPRPGWINSDFAFARELLLIAGFREVARCDIQETRSSYPEIVALDNRPRETLFIEAVK